MTTINYQEIPTAAVRTVYDTAATEPIVGADDDHSILIQHPSIIQIEPVPAGTSLQVQQKVAFDATWVNVGVPIDDTTSPAIMIFDHRPNFVQIVRTGTGDVKAYVQSDESH